MPAEFNYLDVRCFSGVMPSRIMFFFGPGFVRCFPPRSSAQGYMSSLYFRGIMSPFFHVFLNSVLLVRTWTSFSLQSSDVIADVYVFLIL